MANEIEFKPKFRISLLETNGAIISDRLVDAYTELNAGPKAVHMGPVRVEITLTSQQDIDAFKNYLDQLRGNLPLRETTGRGRPSTGSAANKAIETPREDILNDVQRMIADGKDQQQIIKYLRSLGFVFILTEDFLSHFPEFQFNTRDVGEPTPNHQFLNSLSWMVRCVKRAKDPKADKFDPMILFGFSILEGPSKKIVPYLYKERVKPLKADPGKKGITPNQVEFTKMPKYMLEDERAKFTAEQRALFMNPEKQPSKFFLRWAGDVKVPTNVHEALKERVPSLGCLE